MKLWHIGLAVLSLWVIHNAWIYFPAYGIGGAIGGTIGDLRVWLLAIPTYLLYRRSTLREMKN